MSVRHNFSARRNWLPAKPPWRQQILLTLLWRRLPAEKCKIPLWQNKSVVDASMLLYLLWQHVGGIWANHCPFWIEDSSKQAINNTDRERDREREAFYILSFLAYLSKMYLLLHFSISLSHMEQKLFYPFCPLFLLFIYFSSLISFSLSFSLPLSLSLSLSIYLYIYLSLSCPSLPIFFIFLCHFLFLERESFLLFISKLFPAANDQRAK